MRNALPFAHLPFCEMDVTKKLELLYKALVLTYIEDHGGTMPSLGKYKRTLCLTKVFNEGCGVGPERGDGFDVLGRATAKSLL